LVATFPGFSQSSIEKWQVAACWLFKKVLCKFDKFINQKEEMNCTCLSSKEICKFKRLCVKWLRT
jgi:hypothetical protein